MDEHSSTYEDPGKTEEGTNSLQYQRHTTAASISANKVTNVTVLKYQNPWHETSDFHISESESNSCSPGLVNAADEGQNGENVFEVDKVNSLELDNCSIRNKENPYENQMHATIATSNNEIDKHAFSNSSSTPGFVLQNVNEIAETNSSSSGESDSTGKSEQQITSCKEKPLTRQIIENNTRTGIPNDEQSDTTSDLFTDQGLRQKFAYRIGTALTSINKSERGVDIESKEPCLSKQLRTVAKETNKYAFMDTSASTLASTAAMCSLVESFSEVLDSSTDSSHQSVLPQIVENNTLTRTETVCRSPECSVSNCSEKVSHSHTGTDFQPIILDVRGGYYEMETDNGNESQISDSSGASTKSHVSKFSMGKRIRAIDDTDKVELIHKSAFQLLQGMVHVVSANQARKKTSSKAKIVQTTKTNTLAGNEIVNPLLPFVDNANEISESNNPKRSCNLLPESLHSSSHSSCSTQTTLSSKALSQHVSDGAVLHMPLTVPLSGSSKAPPVSVITCPVTCESQPIRSSQLLSNVLISNSTGTTSYSCVFVQDNKAKQNKVALLIPQSSVTPLTDIQTSVTSALNNQTCAAPSGQEILANNHTPIPESISKLVTITMNKFCLQGKDLKDSNLLKVKIPKKNECSQYEVKCTICGEGYYDEQGLYFHLKRTVFHLSFHCSHCKQSMAFYNKCSLWMHLRSETDKPVLNYNDILYLKPYEFDADDDIELEMLEKVHGTSAPETLKASVPETLKASGSETLKATAPETLKATAPETLKASAPETLEASAPETLEASVSAADICEDSDLPANTTQVEKAIIAKPVSDCTVSVVSNRTISVSDSSSTNEQPLNLSQCQICLQKFPNLAAHLCPTIPTKFLCPSCGMFLPSNCAQKAHINIHKGKVKNISCPECGENNFKVTYEKDNMQSVFDHVDSCKHFNRILGIKCFCTQEFVSVNQLMEHFVGKHLRTLYKCPFCVLAFTQHDHFVGHLDKVHKVKDKHDGVAILCLFCQQIVKSVVELRDHLDQHVEHFKNNSVFKWKCFICPKSYVDKAELDKHLEIDHPHKSKRCTICYSLFWSRKNLVDHIVQKKCLRLLAEKLNCCVDMQPEVSEKASESVDLSKLFEVKQTPPNVDRELGLQRITSLVNKSQRLVSIAPKPSSGQPVACSQNNQPKQQNGFEQSRSAQSVAQQHQILPVKSSSSNSFTDSVSPQTCKISASTKSNSTSLRKIMSINAPVIQCIVCKMLIESTQLTNHLKFHQSKGVVICFHCQRQDFSTMKEALKHSEVCSHNSVEEIESQKMQISASSKAKEVTDKASDRSGQAEVEHNEHPQVEVIGDQMKNQKQSVFPCLLCGLAFQSLSAREEHVSRSHDGTRIVYHCGLCRNRGKATIFIKRELASRHITKKHRIVNMDTVNRLIKTEEQNVSSGQKLPACESTSEANGESAPKRLRVAGEGDYMCGKCGFSCSKSEEFSQHITSHNSTQEPQCPECGLCFTILSALKKHLLAVHKIKAVDDYMKLKNIVEPEVEEEEMEILPEIHPFSKPQLRSKDTNSDKSITSAKLSPYNPLECTVCYKVFDSETNLKTHMRNHGMAFIRSKRHKLL